MLKKLFAVAGLSIFMVGCASVPMGDPAKDAELKKFSSKPEVAGVYIYRNESFGGAVKMDVAVDGKELGSTAAKTYLYTEVAPGKHTVTSKAENTAELTLDAVAGKLYYVWQEVKMGVMSARSKLSLVDEETGKKGVNESKLAAGK
ncbi:DUF2846 domain-containing protein [Parachitinimonas caeni]|uniref:DUF2846 domain-containing protein n=1 Tax=Parachitinimonas caeni TaxID=3031301 RepID=A0ABT7DRF4_9NEIS|nr:DUF2846 domain-containing protein [Parachitinimonas caeni]MDK2122643.1 DUF2846 domain-containing protein [Parachitinimonas caeni]